MKELDLSNLNGCCPFLYTADLMFLVRNGWVYVVKRENYGNSFAPRDADIGDRYCALTEALQTRRGTNGLITVCCRCCEEFSTEPMAQKALKD